MTEGRNVCVISDSDAKRLFGSDDVVGMDIDVQCLNLTKSFRIVGVTTHKENGTFVSYTYEGMPVSISIPYTAARDFWEIPRMIFITLWYRPIKKWTQSHFR